MPSYDGVIVGGGHNGLICAAYLARAGLTIGVVERNPEIGGGATTEEVTLPGFRHNLHANFHIGIADAPWLRDLELHRYGLAYVLPPAQHALAFPDKTCLVLHRDPERTATSIARFSRRDAETYRALYHSYAVRMRPLIVSLYFSQPMTAEELRSRIAGPEGDALLSFFPLTMNEAVERTFEHDKVRNIFKLLLHAHTVENVRGTGLFFPATLSVMGLTALAVGGSLSLPLALARSLEESGGTIVRGKTVKEIVIAGGRARAVILDDGTRWEARKFVASAVDFPQTVALAGENQFLESVVEKVRAWQWGAHTICSLHLALNQPPRYAAAQFDPDIDRAFNVAMGPETGAQLDHDMAEVDRGEFPRRPTGNGACDSLFDPTYAPAGKHVAFWWPFARFDLKDGGPGAWDRIRTEATQRLLEAWRGYAPNLTDSNVLSTYLFTPLDIARRTLNMVRGGMRVGAYYPDQLGIDRPHPLLSRCRTPIEGLYLCGSSVGYGGGISGAPGYCAANVIAEDLQIRPWWPELPAPRWPPDPSSARRAPG